MAYFNEYWNKRMKKVIKKRKGFVKEVVRNREHLVVIGST